VRSSFPPDVVAGGPDAAEDRFWGDRRRNWGAYCQCKLSVETPALGAAVGGDILTGGVYGDREKAFIIAVK